MAYFTFRYHDAAGNVLHESDITLHEFIPLVRDLLRSLPENPDLAADPTGYRVLIRPGYGKMPNREGGDKQRDAVLSIPEPVQEGSLLQISEQDLEVYAPISLADELQAFYDPGTSALCTTCPDRLRCPGSGQAGLADLTGWIDIDPASMRSNEKVTYFTFRVETLAGKLIHETNIRAKTLQFSAYFTLTILKVLGHSGLDDVRHVEIIARFEGQPEIAPNLVPGGRPAYRKIIAPAMSVRSERPRRLVDWDGIESETVLPSAPLLPGDVADLEIKVFPTESDPLPRRPPPVAELMKGAGQHPEHLPIFLHRSVFHGLNEQLRNVRSKVRAEVGGILVGEAVLDPEDGRPYVEVVAMLAASDANGQAARVSLDSHFLRQMQERIDREYPGRRTVGWYQFHVLRLAVHSTDDGMMTAGFIGEPLDLLDDELFLHRNFFPQQWHLALVIDANKGVLRFYHLKDNEIAVSTGCRLVN